MKGGINIEQAVLKILREENYKKYKITDVEHLVSELKSLSLSKDMIIYNVKKYGYELELEYVLNCLGYTTKNNRKIKVSKAVQRQAEIFELLYQVDRECFIRLRNKKTGAYRAYNAESLKDAYKLQAILKSHYFDENIDIMYSLNCFNNMYRADEDSLFSLQNIAIDVDFDTKKYTVKQALELVKRLMKDNSIPATLIEFGHCIRLIYSIEDVAVTKKSLIVYKKVAEQLAEKFKELGATAQAPTTYARILGTENSKNGAKVNGIIFNPVCYKLRDLQNALLPEWEKSIQKANRAGRVVKINNYYTLNLARLADLEKIQNIRQEGFREILCYLYRNYCLLSNMSEDEALKKTLKFNARFTEPLKPNTLDGDTKALNRKQYIHKNETILKLLDINYKEEEILQLKTIISKKESNRRNNVYNKNKYKQKLKLDGKMSKREQIELTRQKIKALRQQGFKKNDIMSELNLTESTYRRHFRYLKKNGLL